MKRKKEIIRTNSFNTNYDDMSPQKVSY